MLHKFAQSANYSYIRLHNQLFRKYKINHILIFLCPIIISYKKYNFYISDFYKTQIFFKCNNCFNKENIKFKFW